MTPLPLVSKTSHFTPVRVHVRYCSVSVVPGDKFGFRATALKLFIPEQSEPIFCPPWRLSAGFPERASLTITRNVFVAYPLGDTPLSVAFNQAVTYGHLRPVPTFSLSFTFTTSRTDLLDCPGPYADFPPPPPPQPSWTLIVSGAPLHSRSGPLRSQAGNSYQGDQS